MPVDGKNKEVALPETGRLVQFDGLLQVLLVADSHVWDRATDGTEAMAVAKTAERTRNFLLSCIRSLSKRGTGGPPVFIFSPNNTDQPPVLQHLTNLI